MSEEKKASRKIQEIMPGAEEVQRELGKAKSMDDFFGKEGIFARLFAHTIEEQRRENEKVSCFVAQPGCPSTRAA